MTQQTPQHPKLLQLQQTLSPLKTQLAQHPLYKQIKTISDLQLFMRYHIVAVWDFMSLLKTLQNQLTCTQVPWIPKGSAKTRRLINEIVLEEESDEINGEPISHFEFYRSAMSELNSSTIGIDSLMSALHNGHSFKEAIRHSQLPQGAKDFLHCTEQILTQNNLPQIAAAFALGREDIIPTMFDQLLKQDTLNQYPSLRLFLNYLTRHVELDSDSHGPMALEMLCEICSDDIEAWAQAQYAAQKALEARHALWDSISSALKEKSSVQ